MNFDELNLEIIDVRRASSKPGMIISAGKATLNSRVLRDLESPEYVQYCMDPSRKVFAIRPCKAEDSKAVSFVSKEKKGGMLLTNRNIIAVLESMIQDFAADKRYSIDGEFDAKHRVMFFDMSKAEQKDFTPRGRKKKESASNYGEPQESGSESSQTE